MNYLLASNNDILKFPYSLEELRSDNPQTSFSWEMNAEDLAQWGVFTVEDQILPDFNKQTESIEIGDPTLVDGKWIREWNVIPAGLEEVERRNIAQSILIRIERNRIIAGTDYTQLLDYSGSINDKIAITEFRQALRDVPQQTGFPWTVTWPILIDLEGF